MKVFIAESNDPKDFYDGRLDGYAAHEVLKVCRINSTYKVIMNENMLRKSIKDAVEADIDIFHLSCHGNDTGIQLSNAANLDWVDVARIFEPLADKKRILIYASCAGGHQDAAEAFQKLGKPFGYICGSSTKSVGFHDSCIAWSILYNVLSNANCDATDEQELRGALQDSIKKINKVVAGKFCYRRWDISQSKYRPFLGEEK